MTNDFYTGYQYDRCISRGICTINPTTASLLEVILIYIKMAVFYELKLKEKGIKNQHIYNLVLNSISMLSSNYEISEVNFNTISSAFRKELPELIEQYNNLFQSEEQAQNIFKDLEVNRLFNSDIKLYEYIRIGEKEFNRKNTSLTTEFRNLYKFLFVIIKSFCINILIIKSFGVEAEEHVLFLFDTLNYFNFSLANKEKLKNLIIELSVKDSALMKQIRSVQEENYGKQQASDVSFSTAKGNAVLIVGSNLRELEQILDKFEDENIDIYTHDNMIIAHTFPKFKEYKNLKGQFGQGMENCLLDFATFPGPIILTRYSLYNIENLYRGLLYTTDFSYCKGVIPIKKDDFSPVISAAKENVGFKTGKNKNSEIIGVEHEKSVNTVLQEIEKNNVKKLIIIGSQGYNSDEREYFKNFIKHIPKNTLIVTLSGCKERKNLICLNMRADTYGILRFMEDITVKSDIKPTLIFPYCDRHIVSIIMYLKTTYNNKIFVGKWNQTTLNPNIVSSFKEEFEIFELIAPKHDLELMI